MKSNQDLEITLSNIHHFKGNLKFNIKDFPSDLWDVFDKEIYRTTHLAEIIPLSLLVSTKNQLEDPMFLSGKKNDPRQTAYERMLDASRGLIRKRRPITVRRNINRKFYVVDGNATSQALMLTGWEKVPVEILHNPR